MLVLLVFVEETAEIVEQDARKLARSTRSQSGGRRGAEVVNGERDLEAMEHDDCVLVGPLSSWAALTVAADAKVEKRVDEAEDGEETVPHSN